MGVSIPIGFGHWVLPFQLEGDPDLMAVTMGYKDESTLSFDQQADSIQSALFATSPWAASSISDDYTVGPATVTVMTALGPQVGVASTNRVGTNVTMANPPQNCTWLVSKRTARGGRAGRGRLFFPCLNFDEANLTSIGGIATAVGDSMQVAMNTWRASCAALALPLYLLHAPLAEGAEGPVFPPDAITSLIVSDRIATQRKRLRR